jgi:hypothetical protein
MTYFERELAQFLESYGLPSLDVRTAQTGLLTFSTFTQKVIEDCPLVVSAKNTRMPVSLA